MSAERIELSSGLGMEGLASVSTTPAVQGQGSAAVGERRGRENRSRRQMRSAEEGLAEEFASEQTEDQDQVQDQHQDRNQDDDRLPHHIDSLA